MSSKYVATNFCEDCCYGSFCPLKQVKVGMDDGTSVLDVGPSWNNQYGTISFDGYSVPCPPAAPEIFADKDVLQKHLQVWDIP